MSVLTPARPMPPAPSVPVAPPPPPVIRRAPLRYWIVVVSHTIVDLYPTFIFTLGVLLQERLALTDGQLATLLALNPIFSGASQPLFAWLGDKLNTRMFGPLGLLIGCLCLSALGLATEFWHLVVLQAIGMTGVGVYHPIGAAVAGRLGAEALHRERSRRSARSVGLSIFFTAGMLGGFLGPIAATALAVRADGALGVDGRVWLTFLALPGLVLALLLWGATRSVAHRLPLVATGAPVSRRLRVPRLEARGRAVAILAVSNALRFTTNIGLYWAFGAWAKGAFVEASEATIAASYLLSASTLGMALTGLAVGWLVAPGREKAPMVLSGIIAAPVIAAMPFLGLWAMLPAAFLAAIGFFSVIPMSISLAQRLLPNHTGATGALLMGCGWVVSATGPLLGQAVATRFGLDASFYVLAALPLLASLVCLLIPSTLLRETADGG